MKTSSTALAYFVLIVSPLLTLGAEVAPPNVVIIYADDMGYGDLACQNPDAKLTTPHLDRLASEGVRFTDAHSSSGICSPSRFALLTGQYHWRRTHGIVHAMGPTMFREGDVTLPMVLKGRGYQTAAIGKWHLGWDWNALLKPGLRDQANANGLRKGKKRQTFDAADYDWDQPIPDGPCSVGFDEYFGDGTINFPPYCWIENARVSNPPSAMMSAQYLRRRQLETGEGNWEFRDGPMEADWDPYKVLPTLADRGEAWLRARSADKPFFLYFALPSPHAPIIPNEEFRGKTEAGAYGDFVHQTDTVVGRLLKALDEAGVADNTLVVFSADNGPERYAMQRYWDFQHDSAGGLRGMKRDLWEGGHRVPMIVRWPGRSPAGAVCEQLVGQIDLFATIAAATGAEVPAGAGLDSLDVTPLLVSPDAASPVRESLVHNTSARRWGLRHGDWLYLDSPTGSQNRGGREYESRRGYEPIVTKQVLFNLKEDQGQLVNRFDEQPEIVAQMTELLEQARASD